MSLDDSPARLDLTAVPPAQVATPVSESEVVARFWGRVRLFALRRLREPSAADDVAQEALRRVVEAIRANRIRNPASLPGFVFQTAHHVVLQQHRGAGREARALQRMHSGAEDEGRPADSLAHLITEERRRAVRAALERLDEEDRQLLVLLYQEQAEPPHVARSLGVTMGALRVRKHRALKRLAELLGDESGGNDV
jgi:RNA polymerase sigma-70 factor (ECF subfamily)